VIVLLLSPSNLALCIPCVICRQSLSRVGFLGEAAWERARRATIKALPAALHHPRPYGLTSTFQKNPTYESTAPALRGSLSGMPSLEDRAEEGIA